jgi:hypothetical protein
MWPFHDAIGALTALRMSVAMLVHPRGLICADAYAFTLQHTWQCTHSSWLFALSCDLIHLSCRQQPTDWPQSSPVAMQGTSLLSMGRCARGRVSLQHMASSCQCTCSINRLYEYRKHLFLVHSLSSRSLTLLGFFSSSNLNETGRILCLHSSRESRAA